MQFKKLKLQLSDLRTAAEEAKEHVKQLEAEVADLKATRLEFKASLEVPPLGHTKSVQLN